MTEQSTAATDTARPAAEPQLRPLRILHLCDFFHPVVGGMEQAVLQLTSEMAARGHEMTVYTSDLSRRGRLPAGGDRVHGVSVYRFPAWFRLSHFAAFWPGFCFRGRTRGFDVIHAHSYRKPHCDLASLPFVKGGAKLVIQPHWAAYPRGRVARLVTGSYDRWLGPRLFRHCDLALAITPLEVPWLHRVGARRVDVLPDGIPANMLAPGSGGRDAANRRGGDRDQMLLVSVGRVDATKGFQFVVAALREVPGIRYVIAGPRGPFYPELHRMIRDYRLEERVTLLGEIPDAEKLQLLDACDAFIQPSVFEGFGISALEALARGKPCLGSTAGGLTWVLDGCGLLFPPGDVAAIAQCLRELRDDPAVRQRLAAAGRLKASALTWHAIALRYESILRGLLSRRS